MSEKNKELQDQIAELEKKIGTHETVKPRLLSVTPVAAIIPMPGTPAKLSEIGNVGDKVLAQFSDTDFFACTIVEVLADKYSLRVVGTDDENRISKQKVFPPLPKVKVVFLVMVKISDV